MKLSTILSIVAIICAGSSAYGQITLHEKNVPVEKILSIIEKQTKFVFLYDPAELKIPPVSITVKNTSLEETLQKCFGNEPIEFTIVGNNVLLKRQQREPTPETPKTKLHGRVVDENSQPLTAVSVVNTRELHGTLTDSSGGF